MTTAIDVARDYEALRRPILDSLAARLRGQGVLTDVSDLEDFYNEAWHALYLKLADGEEVESTRAFIAQVSYFRAIDDVRRRHPGRRADGADVDEQAADEDVDARLDDEADLTHLLEGMRDTLDERERQAAVLCYLQGMSRSEAAELLGLPEKRMQKVMDSVSRKLGPVLEAIRRGRWCEERDSLISAYALGLLDPEGERYKLAVNHLHDCSACRRRVLGMRGIAALLPPVLLPWHLLAGGTAAAAGAGATATAAGSSSAGAGGGTSGLVAVAATVAAVGVVAAAAIGLTRHHDKPKPKREPVAAATAAPASTPAATSAPSKSTTKKKAKPKAKKKKPKHKPKAKAAATAAPTTVATTAPPAPTAVATSPPATTPTGDASQEFGLQP